MPKIDLQEVSFRRFLEICMDRRDPCHQEAWQEFDRRYRTVILSRVCSVTKNREHVDDIASKVLMRLILHDFRALRNFRGENEATFRGYLSKIARLTAIAYVMKENLKRGDELEPNPPDNGVAIDMEILHENLVDLSRSVQAETKKSSYNQERDVFVFILRKLSGFKAKDVAKIPMLNLSAGNVDNIINRLTQLISTRLDDFMLAS